MQGPLHVRLHHVRVNLRCRDMGVPELLLDQTQIVAACPVKLAGIGVPETVNRIMRI